MRQLVSFVENLRSIIMPKPPCILWMRNDLRISDNSALSSALKTGAPVVAVYIWDIEVYDDWVPGAAAKVWLHFALKSLSAAIEKNGGQLILRVGPTRQVLEELITETQANAIFWNRRYEPKLREFDAALKLELRAHGRTLETFNSALLNEPHTVANKSGKPFRVYTPYFKSI